ncbi:hypothetical protein FPQ18DRAFT_347950 [Pyronema domesticum]|uniref:Similar to Probable NADP-dependent mannitol dehydrogenase acc. no. O00058 n=1 Tax=Pyronema omphalodes (strain CBS 100304) TaxID=1076935 RepID=U4LBH1_PYROM|nr:hypothetical protein FPQ18DRAFT_347950 [Pyronema domesticum]CCX15956.1 Similar to Probable NADP-dependent mannitol dehydrogenase; acc. no. O00058 [Pyronema omphalodes CBS 100304]
MTSESSLMLLPTLFSLKGKTIVVTGAARGLGLAQSLALIEAGATVHALDLLPSSTLLSPPPGYNYHSINILSPSLGPLINSLGPIHGCIAAAGINQETPALSYTEEDFSRMMAVNVTGVFMTCQAVARVMVKYGTRGSMVVIASMSGSIANRGLICSAYNASKGAVKQLAKNLASEWGPEHGIRVNSISPGYIVTDMVEQLLATKPERRQEWADQNMLKRLSKPEEFSGAAVFLLSEASSFMTGADLVIDGGHSAW